MEKTKLMREVEKAQGRSIIEILREEFNTKPRRSYREIAKSLGVDRTTISEWAKRLFQVYGGCLSVCICPTCKKRYECQDFKESHQKGYCVLACRDYEKSKNS